MDQETLNTLMSMVILPLLLALSGFAVAWLRKKTQEITAKINDATVRKYVDLASDAVTKASSRHCRKQKTPLPLLSPTKPSE